MSATTVGSFGVDVKMNPVVKERWVTALRSGEYAQCKGQLRRGDGYCCLGVLTDIYLKEAGLEWQPREPHYDDDGAADTFAFPTPDGSESPEYLNLTDEVMQWAGLRGHDVMLNKPIEWPETYADGEVSNRIATTAVGLNDAARYNFAQIADVIEEQF